LSCCTAGEDGRATRSTRGARLRLVDAGEMTAADAARVGALVARDNARRAYRL
jgi:hypothetical protein